MKNLPARFRYTRDNGILQPPDKPLRPFEADYPNGAPTDATGRIKHDIEGRPLEPGAYIVGRRTEGADDVSLLAQDGERLGKSLTGQEVLYTDMERMLQGSNYGITYLDEANRPSQIVVRQALPEADRNSVLFHELGHAIDDSLLRPIRDGMPKGAFGKEAANRGGVYDTLNNANNGSVLDPERSFASMLAMDRGTREVTPRSVGYPPDQVTSEYAAEALRAYMENPNYLKTVAPDVAAHIRDVVNSDPLVGKLIQFNANEANASLPYLVTNADDYDTSDILREYGLLPENGTLAFEDPTYDARTYLERTMRPNRRRLQSPVIQYDEIQKQHEIDNPRDADSIPEPLRRLPQRRRILD